jgi:SpoIID/LytB domain protein
MGISRILVALLTAISFSLPGNASTIIPSSFLISGAGLGHGVGMSQVGAFVQAQQGRSAAEIISHYYPNAELIQVQDNVEISVNVALNQTTLNLSAISIKTAQPTPLIISTNAIPKTSSELTNPPLLLPEIPTALEVTALSGNLILTSNGLELLTAPVVEIGWSGLSSMPSGNPKSELVLTRSDGTSTNYRFGPLKLIANGNKIHAVLRLIVKNEYLHAVAEMASTWPTAALQAQAITARSMALTAVNAGIKSNCGCHVNSFIDQNMRGSERYKLPGYPNWRKAINSTSGQVVSVAGKPVAAWFFSRSNGKTENSQDVWGSPRPWAVSVSDEYSLDELAGPQIRWSVQVSSEQLAKIFKLPDVVKVRVVSRNAGGSVKVFRASSSSGETADLPGRTLRAAIPTRSVWIQSIKPIGG